MTRARCGRERAFFPSLWRLDRGCRVCLCSHVRSQRFGGCGGVRVLLHFHLFILRSLLRGCHGNSQSNAFGVIVGVGLSTVINVIIGHVISGPRKGNLPRAV